MGANIFSRINLRQVFGMAVALTYLLAIEHWLGWGSVLEPLINLPIALLSQMVLLLFLTYLVRALRLHSYFRPATTGRFGLTLSIMLTHNVLNHLLPACQVRSVFRCCCASIWMWALCAVLLRLFGFACLIYMLCC